MNNSQKKCFQVKYEKKKTVNNHEKTKKKNIIYFLPSCSFCYSIFSIFFQNMYKEGKGEKHENKTKDNDKNNSLIIEAEKVAINGIIEGISDVLKVTVEALLNNNNNNNNEEL